MSAASARRRSAVVPILAMTANVFQEDVQKCLDAGMNCHLGKPVEIEALFEKLAHYPGQKKKAEVVPAAD